MSAKVYLVIANMACEFVIGDNMRGEELAVNQKSIVAAFVILHYLDINITIKCIKSIQEVITYNDYKIVVIDNGSGNGTGEKLINLFASDNKIKVICLEKNLGFSAGNNVGYRYAKEKFYADYIVVINNDTEMIQADFIEKAIECYEEENYYVMGPDVINLDGSHQSPLRNYIITKKEVNRWYFKRRVFSQYLHIHKKLNLSPDFFIFRKYIENSKKIREKIQTKQENVELQGACIIFSPLFVAENNIAFEELTFLYCEEALLLLRCIKNKWKIIYNPMLKIRHAEEVSTYAMNRSLIEKEIFYSDNLVKAIKAVKRYLADM